VKVNVINENNKFIIDTFDSQYAPKAGQIVTLTTGDQHPISKVKYNWNKSIIEVFVNLPLKDFKLKKHFLDK
jgi:hypothetical protein